MGLKGGFALELRLGGQARATRDVDIIDWSASLDEATAALVEAAVLDLGDYFEFIVMRVGAADIGAGGGIRFRADAYVGGRLFEPLLIDIGLAGGPSTADELTAPDLLHFAEIEPAHIRAIPLEQHIAEKVHAYTRRYGDDQPSSRVKDLIDIVLMSELAAFDYSQLRDAVVRTFRERGTHELPTSLATPSGNWAQPYRALATEVGLDPDLSSGHRAAAIFLDPILAETSDLQRWDGQSMRWQPRE